MGDTLGPGSSILLTVLLPTEPVSFECVKSSYTRAPVFRYTRSQSFDILDIDHKCFVLESPTQLVALHLQGPSAGRKGERAYTPIPMSPNPGSPRSHPTTPGPPIYLCLLSAVKLNIALYRPRSSQGGPGSGRVPVALGIKGYQLYMSCVMSGSKPVLQLEVSRGSQQPVLCGAGGSIPP